MNKLVASTAYYSLNALLFPATLTGYVLYIGKLIAGRRSGISTSAQGPLLARFAQHALGTREDEPASRLLSALRGVSPLGLRLLSGPMVLAHRLTGHVPRAFKYPFEGDVPERYEGSARTAFFDDAIARHLDTIQQLVILGAGFDTRLYRRPTGARGRSFEIDAPRTQAAKREALQKAGIDSTGVTFVAAEEAGPLTDQPGNGPRPARPSVAPSRAGPERIQGACPSPPRRSARSLRLPRRKPWCPR